MSKQNIRYSGSSKRIWLLGVVVLRSCLHTTPMPTLSPAHVPEFWVYMAIKRVFSTTKSARACSCSVSQGRKPISYSLNSSTHFVILPMKSGLCITYRRSTVVSTVMGCVWKYDFSLRAVMTSVKMFFSNGLYRASAPTST